MCRVYLSNEKVISIFNLYIGIFRYICKYEWKY